MELLDDGHLPQAAAPSCSTPPTRCTGGATRGSPTTRSGRSRWPATCSSGPCRSPSTCVLRPRPQRGPGAALPRRRLPGAAPDRAGAGPHRGARGPHRVAGRARPAGRLEPARGVGGAAGRGRTWVRTPPARRGPTPGRRRSPRTARAFRVLVRNALFRRVELAALRALGRSWASSTPRPAGTPTAGSEALDAVLRRARRPRHRAGRPRPGATSRSTSTPTASRRHGCGGCGRSSTTPPATTTGGSPPTSTWRPATRPARQSCGWSRWAR